MSTAARARPRPRPRPPRARRPAARPRRPLAAPPSPRDPASRPPPRGSADAPAPSPPSPPPTPRSTSPRPATTPPPMRPPRNQSQRSPGATRSAHVLQPGAAARPREGAPARTRTRTRGVHLRANRPVRRPATAAPVIERRVLAPGELLNPPRTPPSDGRTPARTRRSGNANRTPRRSLRRMTLAASRAKIRFHVVHITAEMAPIAKVGGLGDVVTGLARANMCQGHDVEVILPYYSSIEGRLITRRVMDFGVPKGSNSGTGCERRASTWCPRPCSPVLSAGATSSC